MTDTRALTVSESDYEAIESAVMETARGRWFLAEYARRNRNADTDVLLQAIGRLEAAVTQERTTADFDRVKFDLLEMAKAISKTKTEVAALRPGEQAHSDLSVASEALDGIVRSTERATSEILEAAEHVQETAWTLREAGAEDTLCSELDRRATEIYTACTFQDLTAQRIVKIVNTLRFLEGRITAMIEIWGGDGEAESAPAGRPDLAADLAAHDGLSQSDVDDYIVDMDPPPAAAARADLRSVEADIAEDADFTPVAEEPRYAVTVFDDELLFVDPSLTAAQDPEAPEETGSVQAPSVQDSSLRDLSADESRSAQDDVTWAAEPVPASSPSTAERGGLEKPEALADIEGWTTHERLARFS